jgi:transcriptional regulator of acetoin/glycerol metabolism
VSERLDLAIHEHVEKVLAAHRWRKGETAKALGIGRATLYRLLKKWDLENVNAAIKRMEARKNG